MMEQRYVKPTATHVAAELLDKKPGVKVPILTREEAQNHKVMLNEKEVLHSHRLYWFGGARRISSFHCWRWWCFRR